jgi:hypothetical protein
MTRSLILVIALASSAWGQSVATQKAFLHAVADLAARTSNGQPIDPALRLQEEIGFSAGAAEAVLAAGRAYGAEADRIDGSLRRSIFTRRLQVAGEFKVTYSAELDLVNWANLDLNLFVLERMDELSERLGTEDYQKLLGFLDARFPGAAFFPLREGEAGPILTRLSDGWKQSPGGFWRDSVKTPLSGEDADRAFIQNYKDAVIPPEDIVPYLEGTVVSVTPADPRGRKILLSMQDGETADAALLIDGVAWKLQEVPEKGTMVQFRGAAIEFTKDPFLLLFAPDRITGLSVISREPNPPFTTPSLAR